VSIPKYYLNSMVKYWKKTFKLILHFSGMRETEYSEITVDNLFKRVNSNWPPLLIDVRSAKEFNGGYGHIPNSMSIPMLELESNLEDLEPFKDREIVTMCPGGGMSLVAAELMAEAGFKDVKSLTGGTDLWSKSGYPTTTSKMDEEGSFNAPGGSPRQPPSLRADE